MDFNSWNYIIFLVVTLVIYMCLGKKGQNVLLLLASYLFYSFWDWRFLSLILISTCVDYVCGIKIYRTEKKEYYLAASLIINLGLLCVFKYFNFFIGSFCDFIGLLGFGIHRTEISIILPVGISFYTFQTLSYTIDIYRKELTPSENFIDFALFVAFFPQLVAGPIERAKSILPQIYQKRKLNLNEFEKGIFLIFYGIFKKVFVADNLSIIVDSNFARSAKIDGPTAYLSVVAFAFQIYADFSAYTDIARGSAKLFGFKLMKNFDFPYLATNPSEFWRKWHISLSTWLRDYLYISLGGNRKGKYKTVRNLMITMTLGGLWHGASWNFIWWGVYHGTILAIYNTVIKRATLKLNKYVSIFVMFQFTLFGWLLFRSTRKIQVNGVLIDDSKNQIIEMLQAFNSVVVPSMQFVEQLLSVLFFILPLVIVEVLQKKHQSTYIIYHMNRYHVNLIFAVILFLMIRYGVQSSNAFIYFQF